MSVEPIHPKLQLKAAQVAAVQVDYLRTITPQHALRVMQEAKSRANEEDRVILHALFQVASHVIAANLLREAAEVEDLN